MIVIDALYINNGGGKVLLDYLIQNIHLNHLNVFFLLDKRVEGSYPEIPNNKVLYLDASLYYRHKFFLTYKRKIKKVFCFGNLPPTIRLKAEIITYFHQNLFLSIPDNFSLKEKISLKLKQLFIHIYKNNTDYWIVQSDNMSKGLKQIYSIPDEKILILPFYKPLNSTNEYFERKNNCYLYISDGNLHKNHENLIEAFSIFQKRYPFAELHLTVSEGYPLLLHLIKRKKEDGLNIVNHGKVSFNEIGSLYLKSEFLLYPSFSESFGLGLIEGINMGCKIVGADLPYVYAVCNPSLTFNPFDVFSIAKTLDKTQNELIPYSTLKSQNNIDNIIKLLA